MNKYTIQHRLHTLSLCYLDIESDYPSFELSDYKFSHWYFNWAEGQKTHFWLIEAQIEADDFKYAIYKFQEKFLLLSPRSPYCRNATVNILMSRI